MIHQVFIIKNNQSFGKFIYNVFTNRFGSEFILENEKYKMAQVLNQEFKKKFNDLNNHHFDGTVKFSIDSDIYYCHKTVIGLKDEFITFEINSIDFYNHLFEYADQKEKDDYFQNCFINGEKPLKDRIHNLELLYIYNEYENLPVSLLDNPELLKFTQAKLEEDNTLDYHEFSEFERTNINIKFV